MSAFDEIVPRAYTDALRVLQDAAPARPASYVREMIAQELGVPAEDLFESIDEVPLGAASIGQVHRATLRGSGKRVVVKVQYPGIEAKFRNDLSTTIDFCKLAMKQHVRPMQEIEKQFVTEFDYLGEAANMLEIGANMEAGGWSGKIVVPRPVVNTTTVAPAATSPGVDSWS